MKKVIITILAALSLLGAVSAGATVVAREAGWTWDEDSPTLQAGPHEGSGV